MLEENQFMFFFAEIVFIVTESSLFRNENT